MNPRSDSQLAASYRRCERLTWRYGTTYYWGALLLPTQSRRHVHAVYALCRLADDVVDDMRGDVGQRRDGLAGFRTRFSADLAAGASDDPVLAAVVHTVRTCGIDPECFDRFFDAMAMDLDVATYDTWDDLLGYMEGSAAVIGEMMLPVLRPLDPAAFQPARSLGLAFQLTNFLRDVGEDLDRGRVYVPQEDLTRFGADPWQRRADPAWRALMRFEIERCRLLYAHADEGVAMLPPRSARCVSTARALYSRILEQIERADSDVFARRARVPTWRKAALAARVMMTGPTSTKGRLDGTSSPAASER
ncbi:MAG: phytoene/squalene synthase family protein [Nocardioidaceae bacterium]